MNFFQPWISDEGPKAPKGWGIATFRGNVNPFRCDTCIGLIEFREQYLYKYDPSGVKFLHNTEKCAGHIA